MTSSARASSVGGTMRPSALAETTSGEFGCELLHPFRAALRPQVIDRDILSVDETILGEAHLELLDLARVQCRWTQRAEIGDLRDAVAYLLRSRGQRPSSRAAEERHELASSHGLPHPAETTG